MGLWFTHIDMSENYISESIPNTLGNLKIIVFLNIEGNNVTSPGMSFLSSLANYKGLEILSFNSNPLIDGELPGVVKNLSSSLEEFYAFACNIKGCIPSEIGNFNRLINIQAEKYRLTGMIPMAIEGL
ncbi:hypothetical protein V6N11_055185 [Hibiscus sabdariffa]|uniref:Uncharacterized protein n=2 Tax=Hibiscus sabdariffa TaxID=183260 RepID=A0ABR2B5I9_9ROSI